jgi:predicted RNA-binding protein with PIN domain
MARRHFGPFADVFCLVDARRGSEYSCLMALVRILVDGYSLLHQWPELAPGQPRHSARAREALIDMLTQYQDASSTPVTVFFDGSGKAPAPSAGTAKQAVEVIYSHSGQTADDLIERAAHRFQPYGEVMVVTNDRAERDTVSGFGGTISSCENFIRTIASALNDLAEDVERYSRREQNRFTRRH